MHSRMRLSNHSHDVVPGALDCRSGRVHGIFEAAGFKNALDGGDLFRYGGCACADLVTLAWYVGQWSHGFVRE